jgi:uncharacterized protein
VNAVCSVLAAARRSTSASTPQSGTLVTGFAQFGLAGLTAVDYLVDRLALEGTCHIVVDQLPAITPFENGTPRHHTRLFSQPDLGVTALVGELFVPPAAAEPLGEAVLEYTVEHAAEEVVVLSGAPISHGPDDHRAFYVASEDFQQARLQGDHGIAPLPGGFLEGVNGELIQQAIGSPLRTCVLTTPVHPQVPDAEAALRLLEAFVTVYDLDVDTGPLEEFAATAAKRYEELATRLEEQREESTLDDRMYM